MGKHRKNQQNQANQSSVLPSNAPLKGKNKRGQASRVGKNKARPLVLKRVRVQNQRNKELKEIEESTRRIAELAAAREQGAAQAAVETFEAFKQLPISQLTLRGLKGDFPTLSCSLCFVEFLVKLLLAYQINVFLFVFCLHLPGGLSLSVAAFLTSALYEPLTSSFSLPSFFSSFTVHSTCMLHLHEVICAAPFSISVAECCATESGYETLTDIQREAILLGLQGKDVLGAARTGSGKTLAFLVPLLEKLWRERWTQMDALGALVISPTRELVVYSRKYTRSLNSYSRKMNIHITDTLTRERERKREKP